MTRVLFLCMGNICRSPAGHCVFQNLVDQAGLSEQFEIDSAGTIDFHVGSPPDKRMQTVMRARNIPVIGTARQLKQELSRLPRENQGKHLKKLERRWTKLRCIHQS